MALLLPVVADDSLSMEVISLAALSLGFIFVGSGNGEVASIILQVMMERDDKALDEKWGRFLSLGLALLYLGLCPLLLHKVGAVFDRHSSVGQPETSDATIMTLKAIEHPIAKQADVLVNMCSAAGTGDVLKVQKLLHHCEDHYEKKETDKEGDEDKKDEKEVDDTFQAFAVIGIAVIAMGEDIGAKMSLRQFNHLVGDVGSRDPECSLMHVDALRRTYDSESRPSCSRFDKRFEPPT